MRRQTKKCITITINEGYIEDVLDFAQINLDALSEEDFLDYREAVYALREAARNARRVPQEANSA